MNPTHMHQVRGYYVFIDHQGNIWKLVPEYWVDRGCPFIVTLLHKA